MTLRLAGGDPADDQTKEEDAIARQGGHAPATVAGRIGGLAGVVRGSVVSYVGRLGLVSEEQFVALVERHGGRFGVVRDRGVTVLGEGDWPLSDPAALGRTLDALDRAERRWADRPGAHGGVIVVGEAEFLKQLGWAIDHGQTGDAAEPQLFSTARLVELLGIGRERLRAWVRAGLISPARTELGVWYFDFREVTAARTLCDLAAAGVSGAQVRKNLDRLRKWVPGLDRPLEQLALIEGCAEGRMLVRLDEGELVEPDGQLQFEFGADKPTAPAPGGSALRIAPAEPHTAADWCARALQQEREGFLEEAAASYREALLAGGPDAQTCLNLGNVLRSLGSPKQALERYAQATETDPAFADAWNNLGTLLVELGRPEDAVAALRRGLAASPDDARAHYNLAAVLDELGRRDEAEPHWRAYLAQDQQSEHAQHARRRMTRG